MIAATAPLFFLVPFTDMYTYISSLKGEITHRKMTITKDEDVYAGLHNVIGRGNISQVLGRLARPHLLKDDSLDAGYRATAVDKQRKTEADEWCEALTVDDIDEPR